MSIQTPTTISLPEGNNGDTTPVQVCLELDNIQAGLERSLDFSLSVALGTAGMLALCMQSCMIHELNILSSTKNHLYVLENQLP